MELILQTVRFLEQKYKNNNNAEVVIFLTKDTIKQLLKQQVELGIADTDEFDFTKERIAIGAHSVKLHSYNKVVVITDEMRLPDDIIGE